MMEKGVYGREFSAALQLVWVQTKSWDAVAAAAQDYLLAIREDLTRVPLPDGMLFHVSIVDGAPRSPRAVEAQWADHVQRHTQKG